MPFKHGALLRRPTTEHKSYREREAAGQWDQQVGEVSRVYFPCPGSII